MAETKFRKGKLAGGNLGGVKLAGGNFVEEEIGGEKIYSRRFRENAISLRIFTIYAKLSQYNEKLLQVCYLVANKFICADI